MPGPRAVCLLSGGLDSAVTLAVARRDGFACHALTVRYGQRHACELSAAARVAASVGVREHRVVDVDLRAIGGSALTDAMAVPRDRTDGDMARGIPPTYVPARNTVFLGVALAWTEVLGARDIFLGANVVDYSGYPDCRPEFLAAFERLAALATKAGVEGASFQVHAPLLRMTKSEIVRLGVSLGVDLGLTHSCYDPTEAGLACGHCDACLIRRKGFAEAGIADPTRYAG
ncbi:MAG: 7-cyano-7-deazaguanine synthase QueC [Myxococcota bacterium]